MSQAEAVYTNNSVARPDLSPDAVGVSHKESETNGIADWVRQNVANPAFNSGIAQPYNSAVDLMKVVTLNGVNLPKLEIHDQKPGGNDYLEGLRQLFTTPEQPYKSTLKETAYENAREDLDKYEFKSQRDPSYGRGKIYLPR